MTKKTKEQLLEDALKSIPGILRNTQVTGSGTWDGTTYVACNRKGRGGRPKFVYRLEDLGGDKFQLTLLIQASRLNDMAALHKRMLVGNKPHVEGDKDACISSGAITASDIAATVKEFYRAYDAEMMR